MGLLKSTNFRAYGAYVAASNYPAARLALEACLEEPSTTPMEKALFLQFIGKTYFYENNIEQSIRYFELGELAGSMSLMPYLMSAKFFIELHKNYDMAIAKCNQIIHLTTLLPQQETEDDYDSDYYIAKAEELKQFCFAKKLNE